MIKKPIELTAQERGELERFATTWVRSVRLVNRAKIIPARDTSSGRTPETQESIAKRLGVDIKTVHNARDAFLAAQSAAMFLRRKKRETPPVPPKATGELEARVIALACGSVPAGYDRWTLRLLADKCVALQFIDGISHTTVGRILKKTNLSLT